MDFKDYQKASLKHLKTCQSILNAIEIFHTNKSFGDLISLDINFALHNVFYLSGYTLESIINYSIFKHYRWKKPSIRENDYGFSDKCGLSYFPDTVSRNTGKKYAFSVSLHQFQRNIQILNKALPGSKIPMIDKTVGIDMDVLKLFNAWCVEVRYHPESTIYAKVTLNYDNVKKFVLFTDTIYNSLMLQVG